MPKHDRRWLPVDGTNPATWLSPQEWRQGRQGTPRLPSTPRSSAALPRPPAATQRTPVSTSDPSPEALVVYQALNLDPAVVAQYQGGTPDVPGVSREEVLQALRLPPAEIAALLKRMQED
jgi:hypothetical protein